MVYGQQIHHKLDSLTIWSRKKKGEEKNPTRSCPSSVVSAISKCYSFRRGGSDNVRKSYPRNICIGHAVLRAPTIPRLPTRSFGIGAYQKVASFMFASTGTHL